MAGIEDNILLGEQKKEDMLEKVGVEGNDREMLRRK